MHDCNTSQLDLDVLPHEAVNPVPHPTLRLARPRLDPLYPLPRPDDRLDPSRNERYRNLISVVAESTATYRSISVRVYCSVHAVALDPAVALGDEDALRRRRRQRGHNVALECDDAFRCQQLRVKWGPGFSFWWNKEQRTHQSVTTSPRRSLPRVS